MDRQASRLFVYGFNIFAIKCIFSSNILLLISVFIERTAKTLIILQQLQ